MSDHANSVSEMVVQRQSEFLNQHPEARGFRSAVPFLCKDGFSMSVQASASHYCSPRMDKGPWSAFEVGFPSEKEELLMKYVESEEDEPTETVYGWVPAEVVMAVVEKHGGLAD